MIDLKSRKTFFSNLAQVATASKARTSTVMSFMIDLQSTNPPNPYYSPKLNSVYTQQQEFIALYEEIKKRALNQKVIQKKIQLIIVGCDLQEMFIQTKNGTRINYIQTRSKNKHKKYDHSTLRNRKKLSAFECLSKLQYSVDLYKKRNEKSVTPRSISEIKQQIHKLRTQSIQLTFSPLITERSTSCGPQNNQTNNYPKGYNNILSIINTQTQSRIHKTKHMLPKITSNQNNQQHDPTRYLQVTQKVTNFNKINQPYLISSIVRVPRIVGHRIKKQAHSDQSNPTQVKINESISKWLPSQIQEPFLREMSNLR